MMDFREECDEVESLPEEYDVYPIDTSAEEEIPMGVLNREEESSENNAQSSPATPPNPAPKKCMLKKANSIAKKQKQRENQSEPERVKKKYKEKASEPERAKKRKKEHGDEAQGQEKQSRREFEERQNEPIQENGCKVEGAKKRKKKSPRRTTRGIPNRTKPKHRERIPKRT